MADNTALFLDFETRSILDLKEVGLRNYVRHPTTDIWCAAYSFDENEPLIWLPGEPCPAAITRHMAAGGVVRAWNAPFEMAIWREIAATRYGWPSFRVEQFECSMAAAYAMGLPGALEDAALALGLSVLKDSEGRGLMLRMARPRRTETCPACMNGVAPKDGNAGRTRWMCETCNGTGTLAVWWDDADKIARLHDYCRQDVRVERELHKRLVPLSEKERRVWLMDYEINERGVRVDVETAKAAVAMTATVKEKCNDALGRLTGGAVQSANAVAALKEWLAGQGCPAESLAKQDVSDLLADEAIAPAVRKALLLRQEASKASTAKLGALVSKAGADGRLRGTVQYHGAATGRWAGRGVQVHNLVKMVPSEEKMDRIFALVRQGQIDAIDMIYGPPMSVVSSCLRGFFVAGEGSVLVAGDFANVEGRGVAWFAGEEWKLRAFREADAGTGPGLYELAYSRMFGVPVEAVKNPSFERQVGKTCLARGTRVLTDRGTLPIEDVTAEVRLWDGEEWVAHSGLVENGQRETLLLDGVSLTAEHLVETGAGWQPAQALATNAATLSRALAKGSENLPWLGTISDRQGGEALSSPSDAPAGRHRTPFTTTTSARARPLAAELVREKRPASGEKTFGGMRTLLRTTLHGGASSGGYRRALTAATTQMIAATRITAGGEFMSSPLGGNHEENSSRTSSRWTDGITRILNWIGSTLTPATRPEICVSCREKSTREIEGKSGSCSNGSPNLKTVYDIANAGPRRRFTVKTDSGYLLVHNCELAFGYGGGVGAFKTMGKNMGVNVPDAKADEFKVAWRAAHPRVKNTWYALERAAIAAVQNPGNIYSAGHPGREVRYKTAGSFLWCMLPSGRVLCYPYPKVLEGDFGPQLTYMKVPSPDAADKGKIIHDPKNSSNWARVKTYGGGLMENVIQAICRDLLVEVLLRVKGFAVLHVHDEIVIEVPEAKADEAKRAMEGFMRETPAWAAGFPLFAECKTMRRYGKG